MRNAFVAKLTEIARENEKIVLLVGDIGFGVFENFKKEFPKRYFNLGIAEQNSIGVVSGLAKEGFFCTGHLNKLEMIYVLTGETHF
jgi:transketolase